MKLRDAAVLSLVIWQLLIPRTDTRGALGAVASLDDWPHLGSFDAGARRREAALRNQGHLEANSQAWIHASPARRCIRSSGLRLKPK